MVTGVTFEKKEIEEIFLKYSLQKQKIPPEQLNKKKVIVLAGPTGCGKSALAMMLADVMGAEIISADSMQVYRGMDIGTAKPSKQDLEKVKHHLIDIRDVTDNFNVVDFYYEAKQACQTIQGRDNPVIVVGGSGFYVHTLLYGPPDGPPSVPEIRKKIEEEIEKLGADAVFQKLQQLDPDYASTITRNDKQKIIRALEIITLTGKKVSKIPWKSRQKPLNYHFHCWFLQRPRETLYHRIEKRCDKMLLDGLVEEVLELEKKGLSNNQSASQAIGYRQTLEYLKTKQTRDDYRRYVELFKQSSRNYAKRQFTWFKQEPLFRPLDLDLHDPETAVDIILQDYECF